MDQKTIDELSRLVREYESAVSSETALYSTLDGPRRNLAEYMNHKQIQGFRRNGNVYVVSYRDEDKPNLIVLRQLVEIP